jgi:uncharacterized protein with PIN domain
MRVKFIADVHLGKLARLLRMLGFDTVYKNDFTLDELLKIGEDQSRILLSRNFLLSKTHTDRCFVVSDENPFVQLKQVIQRFGLMEQFCPFSRCLVCNGVLEGVPKESIGHMLQKNTASYFHEFWQCAECKRIYWKGSHFERMLKTIQTIAT